MIADVLSSDGHTVVNQIVLAANADPTPFGAVARVDLNSAIGWVKTGSTWAAPAVAPTSPAVPAAVTRRQFFQAAAQEGLITESDALALFATGAMPTSLATAIAALPTSEQFPAQLAILGAQDFMRSSPFVSALGAAIGQTSAQIDALFTLAATL